MSWITEMRLALFHESCYTFSKFVAEIQILQLLFLELVPLLRSRGEHRVILFLIAEPESRVVIIYPQRENSDNKSALKDRADLIVYQERGIEISWRSDLLHSACIYLRVCIIRGMLNRRQDKLLQEVEVDCKVGVFCKILKFH